MKMLAVSWLSLIENHEYTIDLQHDIHAHIVELTVLSSLFEDSEMTLLPLTKNKRDAIDVTFVKLKTVVTRIMNWPAADDASESGDDASSDGEPENDVQPPHKLRRIDVDF
jgi:hypothetical protein